MDMVLERGDATELARLLSVSPQLVRAWCRPPETSEEFNTGKFGPLARIRTLISMVKEDDHSPMRAYPVGQYVADMLGGVFVPLPATITPPQAELMKEVSNVLKETGEAIEAARVAYYEESPGRITPNEKAGCVSEINEAIVALVQLRKWIERQGVRYGA
jgi:hypothetical protein